jgi:hypothetical protein
MTAELLKTSISWAMQKSARSAYFLPVESFWAFLFGELLSQRVSEGERDMSTAISGKSRSWLSAIRWRKGLKTGCDEVEVHDLYCTSTSISKQRLTNNLCAGRGYQNIKGRGQCKHANFQVENADGYRVDYVAGFAGLDMTKRMGSQPSCKDILERSGSSY